MTNKAIFNTENDMYINDFCDIISKLNESTPIADDFEKRYHQKKNVYWNSSQEHLIEWCKDQSTTGMHKGFPRKSPNYSAKKMYNRFGRAEALIWLAEALGEDKKILIQVTSKIKSDTNPRTASKIVVTDIPFSRILFLIKNFQNE